MAKDMGGERLTLRHKRPEQFVDPLERCHRWELKDGRRVLGHADAWYKNAPFPFFFVSLEIPKKERRGKGYGTALLHALTDQIKSRGAAGILHDSIAVFEENDPAAEGMYERNGWQGISTNSSIGRKWMAFNLPEGVTPDKLDRAIREITGSIHY